jgi:PAS domain S-box-containing protein
MFDRGAAIGALVGHGLCRIGCAVPRRLAMILRSDDFQLLFESSPSAYLVLAPNRDYTIVGATEVYLRATRRRRNEVIGRKLFDVFPDNPHDPHATAVRDLRASLDRVRATRLQDRMPAQKYDIRRREGGGFEARYWRPTNTPILSSSGELRYLIHQVEDVTDVARLYQRSEADQGELSALKAVAVEREQLLTSESEARERAIVERKKLYAIFEAAPVGIAIFRGPEYVIEYANPAECRIWGRRQDEVVGRTIAQALPEIVAQGLVERVCDPVFRTGESIAFTELPIRFRRDSQLIEGFFNFVHVPVHDGQGKVEGFMALAWDVTDAVHAQQRTAVLTHQLQDRVEFEQQLIGIVSHDLRNPLNVILLATDVMARREELAPRTAEIVLRVRNAAGRALRLVRDVLDFTAARLGGAIAIVPGPTDLNQVVRAVVEELEATHPGRVVEVMEKGDVQGEWDADRIAQVVQNLVTNALSYSVSDAPVRVSTKAENDFVSLCVHNEGEPIPPEKLGSIFQPMQRASSDADRSNRSVGLGLYIVKHLVHAHGGSVDVSSAAGAGTTFTVRLPRSAARL